jgi:hypothetical protein
VDVDGLYKQYNPIFLSIEDEFSGAPVIFPNPLTDDFVLNTNQIRSLKIYSISGQLIKNAVEIGSASNLHFSDLPEGGYVAIVESNDGKFDYQKFVKAR